MIYKIFRLLLVLDKAGILNIPGNKLIMKGKLKEKIKLINVSFIKWIWVLEYIAQNKAI